MYLETRDLGDMMDIYFAAWEQGVKTTYYLHMKPRHTAEQTTVKVNKAEEISGGQGFATVGAGRRLAAAPPHRDRSGRRPGRRGFGFGGLHSNGATSGESKSNSTKIDEYYVPGRPDGRPAVRVLPVVAIAASDVKQRGDDTMGILGTGIQEGLLLKPIKYQWAMDLYDQAVANTWFPNEIQLGEDIADFKRMTDEERHARHVPDELLQPERAAGQQGAGVRRLPLRQRGRVRTSTSPSRCGRRPTTACRFEYVLETFPIDREAAYDSHVDVPSMARKEEFEVSYIKRMTEQTLDITTTEGKQDFVRNLVAYNVILEGIWFYSGFMVALSFRQRNLLRNFGSLIDWIVRDESLHLKFGINLILTVLEENPDVADARSSPPRSSR